MTLDELFADLEDTDIEQLALDDESQITDADTFSYNNTSVRALGFDTPESYIDSEKAIREREALGISPIEQQMAGLQAKAGFSQIAMNKPFDNMGQDAYGRVLGRNDEVAEQMIEQGYATNYNGGNTSTPFDRKMQQVAIKAEEKKTGLFATNSLKAGRFIKPLVSDQVPDSVWQQRKAQTEAYIRGYSDQFKDSPIDKSTGVPIDHPYNPNSVSDSLPAAVASGALGTAHRIAKFANDVTGAGDDFRYTEDMFRSAIKQLNYKSPVENVDKLYDQYKNDKIGTPEFIFKSLYRGLYVAGESTAMTLSLLAPFRSVAGKVGFTANAMGMASEVADERARAMGRSKANASDLFIGAIGGIALTKLEQIGIEEAVVKPFQKALAGLKKGNSASQKAYAVAVSGIHSVLGEGAQEFSSSIVQDIFSLSGTPEQKALGEIIGDAWYAGIEGGLAGLWMGGGAHAAGAISSKAASSYKAHQAAQQAALAQQAQTNASTQGNQDQDDLDVEGLSQEEIVNDLADIAEGRKDISGAEYGFGKDYISKRLARLTGHPVPTSFINKYVKQGLLTEEEAKSYQSKKHDRNQSFNEVDTQLEVDEGMDSIKNYSVNLDYLLKEGNQQKIKEHVEFLSNRLIGTEISSSYWKAQQRKLQAMQQALDYYNAHKNDADFNPKDDRGRFSWDDNKRGGSYTADYARYNDIDLRLIKGNWKVSSQSSAEKTNEIMGLVKNNVARIEIMLGAFDLIKAGKTREARSVLNKLRKDVRWAGDTASDNPNVDPSNQPKTDQDKKPQKKRISKRTLSVLLKKASSINTREEWNAFHKKMTRLSKNFSMAENDKKSLQEAIKNRKEFLKQKNAKSEPVEEEEEVSEPEPATESVDSVISTDNGYSGQISGKKGTQPLFFNFEEEEGGFITHVKKAINERRITGTATVNDRGLDSFLSKGIITEEEANQYGRIREEWFNRGGEELTEAYLKSYAEKVKKKRDTDSQTNEPKGVSEKTKELWKKVGNNRPLPTKEEFWKKVGNGRPLPTSKGLDISYAGIGTRNTQDARNSRKLIDPAVFDRLLSKATSFAQRLSDIATLRSGNAIGSDRAFEKGAKQKEIFTPKTLKNAPDEVRQIANNITQEVHPNYSALSKSGWVVALMDRNAQQVLGENLDNPVDFVVYIKGESSSGTDQALRLAAIFDIPTFNLNNEADVVELENLITKLEADKEQGQKNNEKDGSQAQTNDQEQEPEADENTDLEASISDQQQEPTIANEFINEKGEIDYGVLRRRADQILAEHAYINRGSQAEELGRNAGGRANVEATLLLHAGTRTDVEKLQNYKESTRDRKDRTPDSQSESEWRAVEDFVTLQDSVKREQEKLLRKYAKDNGLWVDASEIENWKELGSGIEQRAYKRGEYVYKVGFNYLNMSDTPLDYLDNRISLYNSLFPDSAYELVGFTETHGITEDIKGPFFAPIVRQRYIKGSPAKDIGAVVEKMKSIGLIGVNGKKNFYTNENYVVEDLHVDNMLLSASDTLYVIDANVRLNDEARYNGTRTYGDYSIVENEIKKETSEKVKKEVEGTRKRVKELIKLDTAFEDTALTTNSVEEALKLLDKLPSKTKSVIIMMFKKITDTAEDNTFNLAHLLDFVRTIQKRSGKLSNHVLPENIARHLLFKDTKGEKVTKSAILDEATKKIISPQEGISAKDIDQRVALAMVKSIVQYLSSSKATNRNTITAMKRMIGKDRTYNLNKQEIYLLENNGKPRTVVSDEIGGIILKDLGVKEDENTQPILMAQLRTNLGDAALVIMQKFDLIEKIASRDVDQTITKKNKKNETEDTEIQVPFVTFKSKQINKLLKGGENVFNDSIQRTIDSLSEKRIGNRLRRLQSQLNTLSNQSILRKISGIIYNLKEAKNEKAAREVEALCRDLRDLSDEQKRFDKTILESIQNVFSEPKEEDIAEEVIDEEEEFGRDTEREYSFKKPRILEKGKRKNQAMSKLSDTDLDVINIARRQGFVFDGEILYHLKSLLEDGANETLLAKALGYLDEESESVPFDLRSSQRSKNIDIEKNIEMLKDLISDFEKNKKSPIYFNFLKSSVGRLMLADESINPQSSKKLLRWLLTLKSNQSKVDLRKSNASKTRRFYLGVGAAFGYEVDKIHNNEVIEFGKKVVDHFVWKNALFLTEQESRNYVSVLAEQLIKDGKVTLEEGLVLEADNIGHALSVLFQASKFTNRKPFEHSVVLETDATASGVTIKLLTTPFVKNITKHLAQLGVIFDTKEVRDFLKIASLDEYEGQNTRKDIRDLYEDLAFDTHNLLNQKDNDVAEMLIDKDINFVFAEIKNPLLKDRQSIKDVLPLVRKVLGSFIEDGKVTKSARKLFKALFMVFVHAGGSKKLAENLGASFMETVETSLISEDQLQPNSLLNNMIQILQKNGLIDKIQLESERNRRTLNLVEKEIFSDAVLLRELMQTGAVKSKNYNVLHDTDLAAEELIATFKFSIISVLQETVGSLGNIALKKEYGSLIEYNQTLNNISKIENRLFYELYSDKLRRIALTKGKDKHDRSGDGTIPAASQYRRITNAEIKETLNSLKWLSSGFFMPKMGKSFIVDKGKMIQTKEASAKIYETDRGVWDFSNASVTVPNIQAIPIGTPSLVDGEDQTSFKTRVMYQKLLKEVKGLGRIATNSTLGIDAAVMDKTIIEAHKLGIHFLSIFDAGVSGTENAVEIEEIYNRVLSDITSEYNVAETVLESTLAKIEFYEQIQELLGEEAQQALSNLRAEVVSLSIYATGIVTAREELFKNDAVFNNMSGTQSVSRYEAKKRKKDNTRERTKEALQKMRDETAYEAPTDSIISTDYMFDESAFEHDTATFTDLTDDLFTTPKATLDALETLSQQDTSEILDDDKEYYKVALRKILDAVGKVYKVKVAVDMQGTKNMGKYVPNTHTILLSLNTLGSKKGASIYEVFTHEILHALTVHILNSTDKRVMAYARHLRYLYNAAKSKITPSDIGQEVYEYIFNNQQGNNIEEFISYGLSNKDLMGRLSDIKVKAYDAFDRAENVLAAIKAVLRKFMELVGNIIGIKNKEKEETILDELFGLTESIAIIQSKAMLDASNLTPKGAISKRIDSWNTKLAKIMQTTAETFNKRSRSEIFTDFLDGNIGNKIADVLVDEMSFDSQGVLPSLLRSISVSSSPKQYLEQMGLRSRGIDREKMQLQQTTKAYINGLFKSNLKPDERKAITTATIYTDASSLIDSYSVQDIAKMFSDDKFLASEIVKKETAVVSQEAIYLAKELGRYLVTGESKGIIIKNPYKIAEYLGFGDVWKNGKLIDELASMYAINSVPTEQKTAFAKVAKNNLNGIGGVLRIINASNKGALKRGYKNALISNYNGKGDIYRQVSKYADIKFIDATTADITEKLGYKTIAESADKKVSVVAQPSLLGTRHGQYLLRSISTKNVWSEAVKVDGKEIKDLIKKEMSSKSKPTKNMPMVLEINGNKALRARYQMSNLDFEKIYGNVDFAELTADHVSKLSDIVDSELMNKEIVDAVLALNMKQKDKTKLVRIAPNSNQKLWDTIPKKTQKYIASKTLKNEIYIHRDYLDMVFGVDDYSISSHFKQNKYAFTAIKIAEEIWQYVVKTAKEAVVLKTPIVLIANIMSNFTLSILMGHNIQDTIKLYKAAIYELKEYEKLDTEVKSLILQRTVTKEDTKAIDSRIRQIRKTMNTLGVTELIKDGFMTSILNSMEEETSPITDIIDSYKHKLPSFMQWGINSAFLTKETKINKFMRRATTISDFIGRYAVYNIETGKYKEDNKDASKSDIAVKEREIKGLISDMFVNYSIPDNKYIDYANNVGVVMFTKYFFRIQKALQILIKRNPVNVALFAALNAWGASELPSVIDSAVPLKNWRYFITMDSILDQAVAPHLLRFVPL